MGYRNKIAVLNIHKHETIKDMTYEELQAWYGNKYVPCYELANEIHEIGKYWDGEFIKKYKKDVFTNPLTNEYFNDEGEFFIIGKEGLAAIIETYRQKVIDYYKSVLNPSETDKMLGYDTTPQKHIEGQLREWDNRYLKPYNMELESPEIVSSWKYEYAIFELVRLYKTIDENTQLICITGW